MAEYRMCTKCVMDTAAEEITFDENGICCFCHQWMEQEEKRKREATNLPWILNDLRKGKKYGCVLGLSGGVDSSTVLHHLALNEIHPLCFSVDNGFNSKEADENIMRLVEGLKVPFERIVLDLEKFRELQSAFIQAGVKNIEIPTDHVLMAVSYDIALKHGVKYIVGGGNHATEGIMPKSFGYQARDLKHIKAIYKKFIGKELTGLPTISLAKYLYCRFIRGIKVINLLDYLEYNRTQSIQMLVDKYGYKPYGLKHGESIFTAWFQNWYLPSKWALDKRKPHLASSINSKEITRPEALQELLKPLEYPLLGIEAQVLKIPKHDHMEYPNNEKLWNLLARVYGFHKKRRRFHHERRESVG